jgi:hypothetical protein
MVVYGIIIGACAAVATSSSARERRHVDARPFSDPQCVFKPCLCVSEFGYRYGENLQVTVQSQPSPGDAQKYQKPDHELNTIADLFAALRSCWSPPPAHAAREGMQMSVLFSFKTSGTMIAPPRTTFATPSAPADTRHTYFQAITASLSACEPFNFAGGLGAAIAGRPIMIRYVDNRDLEKQ